MKFIYLLLFLLVGCSYKTTPIIVAFKKDNLAINDQGFLKENPFLKKIEVYNVGQLAFVLTIKKKFICINNKCYDKTIFIHNLNPNYPTNLFSLLLDKKPIPNIKIEKNSNGFVQKNKDFIYLVTNKKMLFKDKHSNFLFLYKTLTSNKQN